MAGEEACIDYPYVTAAISKVTHLIQVVLRR